MDVSIEISASPHKNDIESSYFKCVHSEHDSPNAVRKTSNFVVCCPRRQRGMEKEREREGERKKKTTRCVDVRRSVWNAV